MKKLLLWLMLSTVCLTSFSQNAADLFFSEYIEGSGNNKYLEIFNGTGADVDLADYEVLLFSNGSATAHETNKAVFETGTILANGAVFVIKNAAAVLYEGEALESTVTYFNGDDAIVLRKISTDSYIDIIGKIGERDNWTEGDHSTLNKTLIRKPHITQGVSTNPAIGFATMVEEWNVFAQDHAADLGQHTFTPPGPAGTLSDFLIQKEGVTVTDITTGDDVTFVWTATDVLTIKFQVWNAHDLTWEDLEGLTSVDATLGVLPFTVPLNATEGQNEKLRIVDTTNPAVSAESQLFNITDTHFAGLNSEIAMFPANNATGVPIDLFGVVEPSQPIISIHKIIIAFDEEVQAGSGYITITKTGEPAAAYTFAITDANVNFDDIAVHINIPAMLDPNTSYSIAIDDGAITDRASTPNVFDGNVEWAFTTGETDSKKTIADIRNESDVPAFLGEYVYTAGVVTGHSAYGFFLQDDNVGWNGIYVYSPTQKDNVSLGDEIVLIAKVGQYSGQAQLTDLYHIQMVNTNQTFEPVTVPLPFTNQWEGMLIKIEDVSYINESINNYGEYEITDGTNTGLVDDWLFAYTPVTDETFTSITGLLYESFGALKLQPRAAIDIVTAPTNLEETNDRLLRFISNPVFDDLQIQFSEIIKEVSIVNLVGNTVAQQRVAANSATLAVSHLPAGIYLVHITTIDGQVTVSKIHKK